MFVLRFLKLSDVIFVLPHKCSTVYVQSGICILMSVSLFVSGSSKELLKARYGKTLGKNVEENIFFATVLLGISL